MSVDIQAQFRTEFIKRIEKKVLSDLITSNDSIGWMSRSLQKELALCALMRATSKDRARLSFSQRQDYFELTEKLYLQEESDRLDLVSLYCKEAASLSDSSQVITLYQRALALLSSSSDQILLKAKIQSKLIEQGQEKVLSDLEQSLDQVELDSLSTNEKGLFYRLKAFYFLQVSESSKEPCDLKESISCLQQSILVGGPCDNHLEMAKAWLQMNSYINQSSCLDRASFHLNSFLTHLYSELNTKESNSLTKETSAIFEFDKSDLSSGFRDLFKLYYRLYSESGSNEIARKALDLYEGVQEKLPQKSYKKSLFSNYLRLMLDLAWSSHSLSLFEKALSLLSHENLKNKKHSRLTRNEWCLLQSDALCGKASIAQQVDDFKESQKILEESSLGAESEFYYYLVKARLYMHMGTYFEDEAMLESSLELCQKALIHSSSLSLWQLFARGYCSLAQMTSNIDYLLRGVDLYAQAKRLVYFNMDFCLDWSAALIRLSQWTGVVQWAEDAIECLQQAQALSKESAKSEESDLFYLLGVAWDLIGEFNEDEDSYLSSIVFLRRLLSIEPSHSYGKFQLALTYLHLGAHRSEEGPFLKSFTLFEELLSQDYEDGNTWNEQGMAALHYHDMLSDQLVVEDKGLLKEILDKGINSFSKAIQLGYLESNYNMCCAYALKVSDGLAEEENAQKALFFLKAAFKIGIHPNSQDILDDEWLESILPLKEFQKMLVILQKSEAANLASDFLSELKKDILFDNFQSISYEELEEGNKKETDLPLNSSDNTSTQANESKKTDRNNPMRKSSYEE